jgi:hypothetical protein
MKEKIRVMHVTGYIGIGGIEELLLNTAKHNLSHKYELSFVACRIKDNYIRSEIENLGYPIWELNITGRMYGAIIHVLTDANLRGDLIEKGLRNAQRFSWEKTAHQTPDVFNALAML